MTSEKIAAVLLTTWLVGCGGKGKPCEEIALGTTLEALTPRARTEPSFGAREIVRASAGWHQPVFDGGYFDSCEPTTCGEHYSLGGKYVGLGCGTGDGFEGDEFQSECSVYVIDGKVAAVEKLCVQ